MLISWCRGCCFARPDPDGADAYAKAHHLSRSGFLAKAAVSEMERQ